MSLQRVAPKQLLNFLFISLGLYMVALQTSMAGMEIFGWLTFLLVLLVAAFERPNLRALAVWGRRDLALWSLLAIVILGVLINASPSADRVFIIGNMRWIFLLYSTTYALKLFFEQVDKSEGPRRQMLIAAGIAAIVAVHGLQMYFSMWDFVRGRVVDSTIGINQDHGRAGGFFGAPITYGNSASQLVQFFLAGLLLAWPKPKTKLAWLVPLALVLTFLGVVMSYSRGAWIAMGVGMFVLFFLKKPSLALKFMGGVATIVLALSLWSDEIKNRVVSFVDPTYVSNLQRLEIWRTNWDIFKMYPLLGVGLGENESRLEEFHALFGRPGSATGHAHNTYLQWLSGTGALGLFLYLAFIVIALLQTWTLFRNARTSGKLWVATLALGAFGAQIALHLSGLTDCSFKDAEVQHMFLFSVALVAALSKSSVVAKK